MAIGTKEVTLKSRFSRVLTVLVLAICVVTEAGVIATADLELILRATAPLALLGLLAWTLFWSPFIRIGPAIVEIVNPFRTYLVTWPAIKDIDTRWSLALDTTIGRITVWSSPAQSRYSAVSRIRKDTFGRADFGAEKGRTRRGDAPSSVAGLAPMLLAQQWQEYRDAGVLGTVEGDGVEVRWHTARIVAVTVLVVLSIAAAAIS
jgi:hypothetical protein